jgi:hypothetical protein
LKFKDDHGRIAFKLHLKNTGHVHASYVLIHAKFFFRSFYPLKELDSVWAECDQFRFTPLETRGSGISIFPDELQDMNYAALMSADDVKKMGTFPTSGSGAPTLAGCIDYGWGGGVTRHQTRFIYQIDKRARMVTQLSSIKLAVMFLFPIL